MKQEEMIELLFKKYNKMTFGKKEVAKILGISVSGVDKLRREKKLCEIDSCKIVHIPIYELARYMTNIGYFK